MKREGFFLKLKRRIFGNEFKNFLKKEGVCELFIKYLKSHGRYDGNAKLMLNLSPRPHYLKTAFIWGATDEGHSFWRKIDDKWIAYCSKNNLK